MDVTPPPPTIDADEELHGCVVCGKRDRSGRSLHKVCRKVWEERGGTKEQLNAIRAMQVQMWRRAPRSGKMIRERWEE